MTDPSDFTDQSGWIELVEPLECCDLGQHVVLYGKNTKFRGIIECKSPSCDKIQVLYDNSEAGYADGYELENCDVVEIRCKLCCDINWYQIDDCSNPDLSVLPVYPPEGQVYLYGGDFNDPDCVFIYQGFGAFKDITSYLKVNVNHVSDFTFDEESYDLTIIMKDGTEHEVTLVGGVLASTCFNGLPLNCDSLNETF